MAARGRFEGWPLFGWIALGLLALTAAVLAAAGTGEAGIRMLIRATARSSLLLFGLAFSASALRRLWRGAATGWLLRNRRQVGVGFAFSHAIHGLAIVSLAWLHSEAYRVAPTTLVAGGFGFIVIAAMAATSSDAAVRALGRERWGRFHRAGGWYLWFIFLATLGPQLGGEHAAFYAAQVLLLLAVASLRLGVRLRARRTLAPSA